MVFGVIWLSNQQSAEMLWFASQMNRDAVVGGVLHKGICSCLNTAQHLIVVAKVDQP